MDFWWSTPLVARVTCGSAVPFPALDATATPGNTTRTNTHLQELHFKPFIAAWIPVTAAAFLPCQCVCVCCCPGPVFMSPSLASGGVVTSWATSPSNTYISSSHRRLHRTAGNCPKTNNSQPCFERHVENERRKNTVKRRVFHCLRGHQQIKKKKQHKAFQCNLHDNSCI